MDWLDLEWEYWKDRYIKHLEELNNLKPQNKENMHTATAVVEKELNRLRSELAQSMSLQSKLVIELSQNEEFRQITSGKIERLERDLKNMYQNMKDSENRLKDQCSMQKQNSALSPNCGLGNSNVSEGENIGRDYRV